MKRLSVQATLLGALALGCGSEITAPNLPAKPAAPAVTLGCAVQLRAHARRQALLLGRQPVGPTRRFVVASRLVPGAVAGGHSFIAISSSVSTACALEKYGAVWCWGDDPTQPGVPSESAQSADRNSTPAPARDDCRRPQIGVWSRLRRLCVLLGRKRPRAARRGRHAATRESNACARRHEVHDDQHGVLEYLRSVDGEPHLLLGRQHVRRIGNGRHAHGDGPKASRPDRRRFVPFRSGRSTRVASRLPEPRCAGARTFRGNSATGLRRVGSRQRHRLPG